MLMNRDIYNESYEEFVDNDMPGNILFIDEVQPLLSWPERMLEPATCQFGDWTVLAPLTGSAGIFAPCTPLMRSSPGRVNLCVK